MFTKKKKNLKDSDFIIAPSRSRGRNENMIKSFLSLENTESNDVLVVCDVPVNHDPVMMEQELEKYRRLGYEIIDYSIGDHCENCAYIKIKKIPT